MTRNSRSANSRREVTSTDLRTGNLKISASALRQQASGTRFRTGPFVVHIETPFSELRERLSWCYGREAPPAANSLVQFSLRVDRGSVLRGAITPQAVFHFENGTPFQPFPRNHAFPLTEWGLNWCIATRAHQFLMLHSAVVERNGRALILPATPGSGKSTLAAAMAHSGWRLLSDEFGLVDPNRPLASATAGSAAQECIHRRHPTLRAGRIHIGPTFARTRKGDVAHMLPPLESLQRQQETARPACIVFPRFVAGSDMQLRRQQDSVAFTRLAHNSFNYRLLGAVAFTQLGELVQHCQCYDLQYGRLEDVIPSLEQLMQTATA